MHLYRQSRPINSFIAAKVLHEVEVFDPAFIAQTAAELGSCHGWVHAISPDVASLHSGHGNVMPMSLHGGPGRAGGGEELGGLGNAPSFPLSVGATVVLMAERAT